MSNHSPLRNQSDHDPRLGTSARRLDSRKTRLGCETLEVRRMLSVTPIIGQVDDFQDGTDQNWINSGGFDPVIQPGGPGGASDLFLRISSGTFGGGPRLVTRNDTQWTGDYIATGVTSVEVDLKNFTASPEAIRIALRASITGSNTPGYSSTTAFALPADGAWHHAVFSIDASSLTGVNSPDPLSTFLTSVADFRILQAASGPAVIGDQGDFQLGLDNITAVGQQELSFPSQVVSMPEGKSGQTPMVFPVVLSHASGATVKYMTVDGTATTADNDYLATSGTLIFAPGVTSQEITVMVNGDAAVEPDENFIVALSDPTNSTILTPQATGTILNDDSMVAGRSIFYSGSSRYDLSGGTNGQTPNSFSDDNAIATDKSAYLPGSGAATFANVISYDRGINGIMVDLLGGGSHTSITQASITNDFTFKVGNNNSPGSWATNTILPSTVTVRPGAGASGSDRIELIWPSGSIKEAWLEVTAKATANTGLPANDVFFFGDAVGNSGGGDTPTLSETNSTDELGARNNGKSLLNNIPLTNVFDYNRDGLINSTDSLLARNSTQTLNATKYLNIAGGGPFAPPPAGDNGVGAVADDDGAVASALASTSSRSSPSLPSAAAWTANRLSPLDPDPGPIDHYFECLAYENTAPAKETLVDAEPAADALNPDDARLMSALVHLGLE